MLPADNLGQQRLRLFVAELVLLVRRNLRATVLLLMVIGYLLVVLLTPPTDRFWAEVSLPVFTVLGFKFIGFTHTTVAFFAFVGYMVFGKLLIVLKPFLPWDLHAFLVFSLCFGTFGLILQMLVDGFISKHESAGKPVPYDAARARHGLQLRIENYAEGNFSNPLKNPPGPPPSNE